MKQQPKLGLLGTSYQIIDYQGRLLETVVLPTANAELQACLDKGNIFCHGSVMFSRTCLRQVGGYHEGFPVTQDYELWLRISEQYELANLAAVLYQFRFSAGTVSRQSRRLQLAYRRLARHMATSRRKGEAEPPFPQNILNTYPPEPERLLGDARHSVYLHYAADQRDHAMESIMLAQETDPGGVRDVVTWSDWAVAKAHELTDMRHDAREGAKFILWLFEHIPSAASKQLARKAMGRFYADQAFKAYYAGKRQNVLRYTQQAMRRDWNWLRNRGLWAISWKALCRLSTSIISETESSHTVS